MQNLEILACIIVISVWLTLGPIVSICYLWSESTKRYVHFNDVRFCFWSCLITIPLAMLVAVIMTPVLTKITLRLHENTW